MKTKKQKLEDEWQGRDLNSWNLAGFILAAAAALGGAFVMLTHWLFP